MPSYHGNSGQKSAAPQCTPHLSVCLVEDHTSSPLKVFGCVSYVHVQDNQRRKLDAKNRKECFCWISSWCQEEQNDLEIKKKYVATRDVQLKTN